MKIIEYRIFAPLRWNQCRIASAYSVNRRTKEFTHSGDGFEILDRGDFEEDGNPGHYVERMLHCTKKVPAAIAWAIPEKYAHVHESNRNAFPHTVTTFDCAGMGDNMILHTETRHATYQKGKPLPDNLLNLNKEELGMRQIFYLDLLNGPSPKNPEFDLHGFSCPEADISELVGPTKRSDDKQIPEWVEHYDGEVTLVVKVVKFMFKWRGLQTMVESLVSESIFYHVYLDSHRAMVKWSPEWSKMTIEEVFEMEGRIQEELATNTELLRE